MSAKKLTPEQMAKVARAFSNLSAGDCIVDERDDDHLAVIRIINGGAVLGSIGRCLCGCGKTDLQTLLGMTYHWSQEKEALTDSQGNIPSWWSPEHLSVLKCDEMAVEMALKYHDVPIPELFFDVDRKSVMLKHAKLGQHCVNVLLASQSMGVVVTYVMDKLKNLPNKEGEIMTQLIFDSVDHHKKEVQPHRVLVVDLSEIMSGSSDHVPKEQRH